MIQVPSKVNLNDGEWKHLGSSTDEACKQGLFSDLILVAKDGLVMQCSYGKLQIQIKGSEGDATKVISALRSSSKWKVKIELSYRDPHPALSLPDGLWVCEQLSRAHLVFENRMVMSGTYETVRQPETQEVIA